VRVAEVHFEGPQSQLWSFFSPHFRNRFGCSQYCGSKDKKKLRMPTIEEYRSHVHSQV
jgi:hypothetical protein